MFKEARIKLTLYYLVIVMAISVFFSLIIYSGATLELRRIEDRQRLKRPNPTVVIDPDLVYETKTRIAFSLLSINLFIFIISSACGYFLAGKTLKPIKEMMDEQKEFIGNASHELRTPLTSLKTEIEVALRDKKLNLKEAREMLQSNLEDVNNMTKLSNYLLELNKFQNGSDKLTFSRVDLSDIAKIAIGKRKIRTKLEKSIINGNEDSLVELITILIDNAIKYSGVNNDIYLGIKNKTIEVVDHGAGIAKEDLPHIFDRFYRGDKLSLAKLALGKARGKDGYGLGLSIAKQIADIHRAKIIVESKLGKGSTFKVIFS